MKSKKLLKSTVSVLTAALLTLSSAALPAMAEDELVTQAEYGKLVLVNSKGVKDTAIANVSSSDEETLTVTPQAEVTEAGDASTAMKFEFVESEARSLIRFNTSTLSELTIDDTYLEFDLYLPTAETPADMRINLWLDISGWPSLKNINNIATKGYVKAQAGWQSVRIPLDEFTDGDRTTHSFDSLDTLILSFSFLEATTSTFYMKNIEFKTELSEVYDYDFEGEGIVRLIQDGKVVDGVTMTNVSATTEAKTIDGIDAIYTALPNSDKSGLSFSSDSIKAITNLKDYQLLWKVKFTAPDYFAYALYTVDGEGTETRYANIGQHIKATDDWQTVVIPLSSVLGTAKDGKTEKDVVIADGAITDLSTVAGINLRRTTMSNAWSINYTAVQKHYCYISDLALVPKTATQINNYTNERILKDYQVLYRNGVFALPWSSTTTFKAASKSLYGLSNDGNKDNNMLRKDNAYAWDLKFDVSSLGLTDSNYSNKFLKFEVCPSISDETTEDNIKRRQINVYRSATDSIEETTEGVATFVPFNRVGDIKAFRQFVTMLIPFEKLSQDTETLSWNDVKYLTIRLNAQGKGSTTYAIDNISIVELVDGEYTSTPDLVKPESNTEAYAQYTVSNSMKSAYRFNPTETVIVSSYDNDDNRLTGVEFLEFESQLVNPGTSSMAIKSSTKLALPAEEGTGGTVKLLRWNDMKNMIPLADAISTTYVTASEGGGLD